MLGWSGLVTIIDGCVRPPMEAPVGPPHLSLLGLSLFVRLSLRRLLLCFSCGFRSAFLGSVLGRVVFVGIRLMTTAGTRVISPCGFSPRMFAGFEHALVHFRVTGVLFE